VDFLHNLEEKSVIWYGRLFKNPYSGRLQILLGVFDHKVHTLFRGRIQVKANIRWIQSEIVIDSAFSIGFVRESLFLSLMNYLRHDY